MANLTVSAVCNQHCPYCFTSDHLNDGRASRSFLEIGDFDTRLDFLDRSGIDQVRLLGGEPTLHPQFPELVGRARARGKKIVVFTNGLMSEESLACLEELPATECTVLVNVNDPAEAGEETTERQRAAIHRLGERALLGFNIYRADFQPDFLLSLIAEASCRLAVRLGIAHPCLSGDNRYIHPNQYVSVGQKIVRFARVAARAGVTVEFDCGFVRCMFSDEDLKTLEALGADVGWRCNPILDVGIDGQVIHCYPLSRLGNLPLTPETDAPALRSAFESLTRSYRQAGVFQECSTCPFKLSGVCPGGCLAATMRRFRHTSFSLVVPRREMES
jgi:radical SAM protein with 4Fe4S-binding SPASM domain